jgi:hypothetical protein
MKSDKIKLLSAQSARGENPETIAVVIQSSVTRHKIAEKTVSF